MGAGFLKIRTEILNTKMFPSTKPFTGLILDLYFMQRLLEHLLRNKTHLFLFRLFQGTNPIYLKLISQANAPNKPDI